MRGAPLKGEAPAARYKLRGANVKVSALALYLFHLRSERFEALDPAATANPGLDGFALRTDPIIVWLQVETLVEIERRTFVVHDGADAGAIPQQEIDRGGPRPHGPGNAFRADTSRALFLFPFDILRPLWPWPDGNADEDLVLDDDAPNHLRLRRLLRRHAEQAWKQTKEGEKHHAERTIAGSRSTGKR